MVALLFPDNENIDDNSSVDDMNKSDNTSGVLFGQFLGNDGGFFAERLR